ncbi:MAG TPA: Nramp family divalent metal transporter, partial [Pirellulales bacterium]|nr:Nramp family divalent metal transporter [Pirellulales bacterium]
MASTDVAPAEPSPTDVSTPKILRGQGPYPGSHVMPRWDLGPLCDAPAFKWKNWASLIGPGLVMGAASIGGGEWLAGPVVTAKYGGALLWLATISILSQVVYNLEISRYTLYSGEPIFTGIFRVPPGPLVWFGLYLLLDFGSFLPYLASSAATPLAMIILEDVPDLNNPSHRLMLKALGC